MLSSLARSATFTRSAHTFTSRHLLRPAFFSAGTHDDFAPQRKVVEGEDEALKLIKVSDTMGKSLHLANNCYHSFSNILFWIHQEHVESNPIMLYMKGNPSMPMCGFSAQVVQALQAEGVDFSSVNVLDYPDIRDGVKKFA